jgi:hypothetical protein
MKSPQSISLAVLLAAGALLSATIASAEADVVSDTPPPAARVEHPPAPRDGYAWAPGHWEWNGRFFSWTSGTWIPERRRSRWVADRWEQNGNQWHYIRGHWEPISR